MFCACCHVVRIHVAIYTHNYVTALPKPATYAHYGKEQFLPSMDSSIKKLTNCQYTTAKC